MAEKSSVSTFPSPFFALYQFQTVVRSTQNTFSIVFTLIIVFSQIFSCRIFSRKVLSIDGILQWATHPMLFILSLMRLILRRLGVSKNSPGGVMSIPGSLRLLSESMSLKYSMSSRFTLSRGCCIKTSLVTSPVLRNVLSSPRM